MKKRLSLLMILLMASLMLTACGGASSDKSAPAVYNAAATMAETAAASVMDFEAVKTEEGAALGGAEPVDPVPDTGRKLIRTVNLDVETDSFDDLLTKLKNQIQTLNGYIEQSDISGKSIQNDHSRRHAYMTVRIPSTELDHFISTVEAEGNVTNKYETTTDVTLQYSDLESRKKSLTIEQDRIWELLEKADTLESVIALEERLSEIRYELESMESRLRLYDNQVDYSTVHVSVHEVKIYTPTEPETIMERIEKGFAQNVEKMKTFAEDLFVLIITAIPIWLPALILLIPVIFFIKRRKSIHIFRQKMLKQPNSFTLDTKDKSKDTENK